MLLLETRDLEIGYQPEKVLQSGIDFRLSAGTIVSLMGQNGVGKTTFIKTIHGLMPALAGQIEIMGEDIAQFSRQELATKFAVVLTEKPPVSNITVRDLIALGRHPHNNWLGMLSPGDKVAIDKAIDLTRINYIADKSLHELSDGQFQKVMIARALAQETDIIVLDEPVAHLDLNNKIEVLLLLRQIADEGKGVLISTHDMQVTTQLSDELWLFDFNTSVRHGLPEDLIVSGTLSKALFLEEHPYDLIHHRLLVNTRGPAVQVEGDPEIVYWTSQALHRGGFKVASKGFVTITCSQGKWQTADRDFYSIRELIAWLSEVQETLQKANLEDN